MGITFRHDAAAVALPTTNASGRKYGQQLVLQQQQQKYATQQAQQDRMFDAYKMQNQNLAQQQRDWQQRDFILNRDRDQNNLQQQQMEAARQQQFMDEARKMESGMIMNDIQNGLYDTNTARELQQTLLAESEALGNPNLDATQRADALQKIRARRAVLAANRMEKPPEPTPQERFEQGIVNRNGVDYIQDSKGNWNPLEPSKAQQEQERMQQQQMQQQEADALKLRPVSAQEYYSQNEDKFQRDLDATMKAMQAEYDAGIRKEAPTPEAAWEQMQKNHDFKQKALGKAQYGEPTLAPPLPEASASQPPLAQQQQQPAAQEPTSVLPPGSNATEMFNRGYQLVTPPNGGKPYWYHPGPNNMTSATDPLATGQQPAPDQQQSKTGRIPFDVPKRTVTLQDQQQPAANNPWKEVATPESAATKNQPTTATNQDDEFSWGQAFASATDDADRAALGKLQQIHAQSSSPEIRNAIGIVVNPNSSIKDLKAAVGLLKAAGVNLDELATPPMRDEGNAATEALYFM